MHPYRKGARFIPSIIECKLTVCLTPQSTSCSALTCCDPLICTPRCHQLGLSTLLQAVDTESVPWDEPDPEQPTERYRQMAETLRLAICSLSQLTRLRLRGVYPLYSALSELPPLQVGYALPSFSANRAVLDLTPMT